MVNHIQDRIRELLILNNGNLRINDYPDLIADALAQGIYTDELNKWANKIYHSINWSIFEKVDEKLIELLNQREGIFKEQDAQIIVELAKEQLDEQQVISYLVQKLAKLGLEPRDRIPLHWSSFINPWMTEVAWKRLHEVYVIWLGEKASTLEKLAEISYRKKEETKEALRRIYKLPAAVIVVTRDSSADEEYVRIIAEETDLEKRYLRALYRLDPFLPFRFKNREYKNIDALLHAPGAFWALAAIYQQGHMQIWVKESSPANAHKLTNDSSLNGFLTFLYAMDYKHPFYIGEYKFETPAKLVEQITSINTLWLEVAKMLSEGTIQVWFAALGKINWNNSIKKGISEVIASDLYSDDEVPKAAVQVLINSVTLQTPLIESSRATISLIDIEAGSPFDEVIHLNLAKGEFVKAAVTITGPAPGMRVAPETLVFEFNHHTRYRLSVRIDPTQLIRNKDYQPRIIIKTLYQRIEVRIFIRVVYPKKAVMIELGKHAAIFSTLFGFGRLLIGGSSYFIPVTTGLFAGIIYGAQVSINKYNVEKNILYFSLALTILFLLILLLK